LYSDFDCLAEPPDVAHCADRRTLDDAYVYLFGVYLGDGMLSRMPKHIWRLRIFQDRRYPAIVDRIRWAAETVSGTKSAVVQKDGCVEIGSYSKHWHCLFPQHGSGPKHLRSITLTPWQEHLVKAFPHEFIRGLIHSDGCRATNRVTHRRNGVIRTYEYPRYFFSNRSDDIRDLFMSTCASIGVEARLNNWFSVSVAKRESVARLESFIGAKS
jgi:hypothetical protein